MAGKTKRRGPGPNPKLMQPDYPYTMRLPDGRTLCVEVPGRWMATDRDGTPAFEPEAVRFLDRIRAAFLPVVNKAPSPGFLMTLREALGLTQRQFGDAVQVDKMTVSRWERGEFRPSSAALMKIEKLRKAALRRGLVIPG